MAKEISKYFFMWVILVLLQVLLLNHIQLWGFVNPYLYVLFLLLLPFEIPGYLLLVLGFLLGLSIDIFTNTPGLHTSATTFMAFLRPSVIRLISSRDIQDIKSKPRIKSAGFGWFFRYTVILVLAHHLFLFVVESFSLNGFIFTIFRSLASAVFTIVLIIISQYLFYKE